MPLKINSHRVRHIGPNNPELANRAGTIQEEPVTTEGVVYVVRDGGPSGWRRWRRSLLKIAIINKYRNQARNINGDRLDATLPT